LKQVVNFSFETARRPSLFLLKSLYLINKIQQDGSVKAAYQWLSDGTKVQVQNSGGSSSLDYLGSLKLQKGKKNYYLIMAK